MPKYFGLVLLPDADDRQQGEQDRNNDADRRQHTEEPGRAVAALIILARMGAKNCIAPIPSKEPTVLKNREQRALLGVVGQNGLPGTGAAGLEGVADDPHCVQRHKHGVARPHHRGGNQRGEAVQHQNANRHDEVADDHKRAELAKLAVGAVHQRADDGSVTASNRRIPVTITEAKIIDNARTFAAEGRNIRQHQNIIHVRGTVVQREQDQLIMFGAVGPRCCFCFSFISDYS